LAQIFFNHDEEEEKFSKYPHIIDNELLTKENRFRPIPNFREETTSE
jgi:hypothetical protein